MSNDTPLEVKLISQGAQQAAPAAVPGWKLVPVEPTLDMLMQMVAYADDWDCYRAMLAAAPTPPAQQSQWVRDTPTEQARYWYWDGHEDSGSLE